MQPSDMLTSFDDLLPERALMIRTGFEKKSRYELSLSCSDIPRMDLMSKSDPFCFLYVREGENCWKKVFKTETIHDTHACKWLKKYFLRNEEMLSAEYRLEIYDRDSESDSVGANDFIGYIEGRLFLNMIANEVTHDRLEICKDGKTSKLGFLFLTLDWVEEPLNQYNISFDLEVNYSNRVKLYYQIMRKTFQDSQYILVHRSKLLEKTENKFKVDTFKLTRLCAGSTTRTLRIELFQFQPMGRSKLLGYIRTTVDELVSSRGNEINLQWTSCNDDIVNPDVTAFHDSESPRSGKTFKVTINVD